MNKIIKLDKNWKWYEPDKFISYNMFDMYLIIIIIINLNIKNYYKYKIILKEQQ